MNTDTNNINEDFDDNEYNNEYNLVEDDKISLSYCEECYDCKKPHNLFTNICFEDIYSFCTPECCIRWMTTGIPSNLWKLKHKD